MKNLLKENASLMRFLLKTYLFTDIFIDKVVCFKWKINVS